MRNLLRNCGALLSCLLLLGACNQYEDFATLDGIRYSAEYAIPLVDSEVSLDDFLGELEEDAALIVATDGQLHLTYSGDVLSRTTAEVFADLSEPLALLSLVPIPNGRQGLPFALPEGLELDRVDLKSGQLVYTIRNGAPVPVTARLILPTVTRGGDPLLLEHELPAYSGSGPLPEFTQSDPLDLTAYQIASENDSIFVEFTATGTDGELYPPGAGSLISLTDIEFSYAEGYLGQQLYRGGRDTIEIDLLSNYTQGTIFFRDPTVTFNFINSFGVPTVAVVNLFNVITVDGQNLPLESAVVNNGGIEFPYPGLDEVGQSKTKTFVFDATNSNIDDILGAGPVAIDYDVDALTNPEDNETVAGFLTDSSFYRVQVDVDLPLYGTATDFLARDTLDINLLNEYPAVASAEFKLTADNGIPLGVALQGYFLDESGAVIDSLFADQREIVAAAPVAAAGLPTASSELTVLRNFDSEAFVTIRGATRIVLAASFSTTPDVAVRLKNDQRLRLRLGAIVNVIE
jgi:hypothetical protein